MIEPHESLAVVTPDIVAECWNGVLAVPKLYEALWGLVDKYDNSYRENIEDMGPHDVIGINSVASFWDQLSDEHKTALNRLATGHVA